MALRSKVPPVGSAQWILSERHQANQFVEQEVEEYTFSVRNEMEWLNEHMAEIFSHNQLNVTDIFKTPGKLRGKTPRTARKRNPLEARPPLTDVFAPNPQFAPSPSQKTQFYKSVAQFQVAEDQENHAPAPASRPRMSTGVGKENTDSGYHGTGEDEIAVDRVPVFAKPPAWNQASEPTQSTQETIPDTQEFTQIFTQEATQSTQATEQSTQEPVAEERRTTEESFVSAEEVFGSKNPSKEDLHEDDVTIPDEDMNLLPSESTSHTEMIASKSKVKSDQFSISAETASVLDSAIQKTEDIQNKMDIDDVRSPSDGSSPVKPLVRKSSLTFACLPAREPLVPKKSMGNRVSRTSHIDQSKARGSQFGRFTGGKSLGGSQYAQVTDSHHGDPMDLDSDTRPELTREESKTTKIHNKTSTQRLHERINMLGQSKERESSKSSSQNISSSQPNYPQLPTAESEKPKTTVTVVQPPQKEPQALHLGDDTEEEDDDWIAPIKSTVGATNTPRPQLFKSNTTEVMEQIHAKANAGLEPGAYPIDPKSPSRGNSPFRAFGKFGHSKSASASAVSSPTKSLMAPELGHLKAISVSNPDLSTVLESTTPAGSPAARKYMDGPLSASKARLYSALKAAKEKFIGSSATSAQVKLDALSPGLTRQRLQPQGPSLDELFSPSRAGNAGTALYPNLQSTVKESVPSSAVPGSPVKETESRRTRSSSEREEKRKEREEKEKHRVEEGLEKLREKERQKAASQFQKAKAAAKEPISVPQESQSRFGAANRTEVTASQDERANSADEMPPPPPKSLLPTGQAQKLREARRLVKPTKDALPKAKPPVIRVNLTGNRFGQPNAPVAQPPQAKQQSAAAKQSNESFKSSTSSQPPAPRMNRALAAAANKKKEEERKAAEKEHKRRELEQKRAEKIEEERLEREQKSAEQEAKKAKAAQTQAAEAKQRQQAARPLSRLDNNLANALQQEKSQVQAHPRGDLGAARPISRMHTVQEQTRPVPQINPAKPPKRVFQLEEDEPVQRPAIQRAGPSFQQLDAKRRRTIDEDEEQGNSRPSVKAPPIRHSNIRKDVPNKFPAGYMPAPQSTSTMLKTATAHAHLQHGKSGHANEMAKFANGKIPFADAPNPPAGSSSHHAQTYKTPVRGGPSAAPTTAAKSSPHYPNGENIALPEIATDSEDEDSDTEFEAPSWANSPALRELLTQQQLVDPEQVFGPIAPLQMEQVFQNKDRHKQFRPRTSSANWSGTDQLTEEDRRKDREARERMMRDGGWQFHLGT